MKMEYIQWIDPFVLDRPWNSDEEIEEKLGDMNCHTIGFIQQETDDFVVLAQGYSLKQSGEVEEWGHCWVLPKICITSRELIWLDSQVPGTLMPNEKILAPADALASIRGFDGSNS